MSSQVRILFPPPSCPNAKFFSSFAGPKYPGFRKQAGVAQLVERQPSKLQVAGSSLVSRSVLLQAHCVVQADVAQG